MPPHSHARIERHRCIGKIVSRLSKLPNAGQLLASTGEATAKAKATAAAEASAATSTVTAAVYSQGFLKLLGAFIAAVIRTWKCI